MSLTYDSRLQEALSHSDQTTVVGILERRMAENTATASERLLCGVSLLMPPFVDYEAASRVFVSLLDGDRSFEAAAWDAYRFAVLLPDGDSRFEKFLTCCPHSAIAAHLLSMLAAARGEPSLALSENRRSRKLRLFPFNIADAFKIEPALTADERSALWWATCDLVVSRSAESDEPVSTVEGALQRLWDSQILGTRLTTVIWDDYCKRFGLPSRPGEVPG